MIYDLSSYLILIELREFPSLLLFAVILGFWTYVFVIYFKSRSNTPQIDSNQFRILTINDTEKYSGMGEKQIQPHTLNNFLPFVSVIVPVRNEEKYIQRCLLSLLDQDYPYFEVIVIDDNSTDNTLKLKGLS